MEKQDSRLKKQDKIFVFACPFCISPIWFNYHIDLIRHLKELHLIDSLNYIAVNNKKEVTKTQGRWLIKCK